MSATIIYRINEGRAPFRVWLWGSALPLQVHQSTGVYAFENVECGEYFIRIIDAEDCLYQFPVSYPCPTTTTVAPTTTTTESPTTTTTTFEEYPCNYTENYYGYEYLKTIQVNLGTSLGAVLLDFNFFYIPIKITVEFDGVEVINTGYRGNTVNQVMLNAALVALGEPSETINPVSQDTLAFLKESATETAIVRIYTPLDGSIATWTLRCPVATVESFEAEWEDHVCGQEEPITTTTTTIP